MSSDVSVNISLKGKQESRQIVKEIMNFGISQEQLFDIMFNLSLNIENNNSMKDVSSFLKKYTETFNKEDESDKVIKEDNKKILLT